MTHEQLTVVTCVLYAMVSFFVGMMLTKGHIKGALAFTIQSFVLFGFVCFCLSATIQLTSVLYGWLF